MERCFLRTVLVSVWTQREMSSTSEHAGHQKSASLVAGCERLPQDGKHGAGAELSEGKDSDLVLNRFVRIYPRGPDLS